MLEKKIATIAIALTTLVVVTSALPEYITMAQKPRQKTGLSKSSPKELVIELRPVSYRVEKTSKSNIGYIRLKQFSAIAAKDMQNAIQDLENKQVAGYI
jgi:C-terminal processing protease CtpA/Prc